MLRWRLLVAATIFAPLAGLLVADSRWHGGRPGIWLAPLAVLLAVAAVGEVLALLRHKGLRPAAWSTYAGTLLVVAAGLVPVVQGAGEAGSRADATSLLAWPLAAVALAAVLAFAGEMIRYRAPGAAVVHVALAVFTVVYIGVPLTFLVALRVWHGNRWGLLALVSAIFVTKMADTGAYACGRLFGRHKMTPVLSPKKTIEGGLGGLVTAWLSACLFFYWVVPQVQGADAARPTWWGCLVYGVGLGVAGALGDLSESLLKRDMECKDSSAWLPGLGGVLDVLDSLLVAGPVAYLCWAAGVVGPG